MQISIWFREFLLEARPRPGCPRGWGAPIGVAGDENRSEAIAHAARLLGTLPEPCCWALMLFSRVTWPRKLTCFEKASAGATVKAADVASMLRLVIFSIAFLPSISALGFFRRFMNYRNPTLASCTPAAAD